MSAEFLLRTATRTALWLTLGPRIGCRMKQRRIIEMVTRNQRLKRAPEKWQSHKSVATFDLVVCFEKRVFDMLVDGTVHPRAHTHPHIVRFVGVPEVLTSPRAWAGGVARAGPDLQRREVGSFEPVHVVNLEVRDTTEAAAVGAKLTLRLAAEVRTGRVWCMVVVCVLQFACVDSAVLGLDG